MKMQNNLDGYKKNVETLPLIKHYLSELGVYELLKKYVEKGRSHEEPAEGLSLLMKSGYKRIKTNLMNLEKDQTHLTKKS
jgi:hypothetical protein